MPSILIYMIKILSGLISGAFLVPLSDKENLQRRKEKESPRPTIIC